MVHLKCNVGEYAVLMNSEGKVLVVQLPQNSHHPGHWMLPGGRMEEEDDAGNGVIRELREETNLEIEVISPCHVARWGAEEPIKYTVFFLCICKKEDVLLNQENQSYSWVDIDEIDTYKWLNVHFPTAIKKAQKIYHKIK